MTPLTLCILPGRYGVARLRADDEVPDWALHAGDDLASVTRSANELSVLSVEERIPAGVQVERGWRALRVVGPLDFALVGILADLCQALAGAGVSVFALSTFDTDVLLVHGERLADAVEGLRARGHTVRQG